MSVSECANALFTYNTELFVHENSNVNGVVSSESQKYSTSMGFRIRMKTKSQIFGLQISFYSIWDQRKIEVCPQVFKAFPSFSTTLALSAPNRFKFVSF